ncbi:hypothetical protein LWI29_036303 [Acer saccharum]|uniref:Uncharacterized GPI-anchored protein At5g19230-like domain-containing protein n=1 Tax=Acer saccharum TaxID=4024 RepID=A0AA39T8L2_ACESA|nr:hypothetical protein LWI29_036303 [Acer saccharum]
MASATQSTPLFPKLPKVIIKLDHTNYLLWKSQLLPIFYGSDLMGMIDGTVSAPSETITVDSNPTINPEFLAWKKKDQLLLSWLHTTMTPQVFAQVINYTTAHSTWQALARAFTSQTNARYYQIKHDLSTIRKGSKSVTEYMDRIRLLTDELSLIQQPMSDRAIIGCVLDGLDLDYDVVVNTVQTMSAPPSFEEIYSMLLNREKRLEVYHSPSPNQSTTAFFTSGNRSVNQGTNNRGHSRGINRGRSSSRGYRANGRGHRANGRGHGGRTTNSHIQPAKSSQDSSIVCQICTKPGHGALTCCHRANFSYQPDDLPAAFSAMNLSNQSYDPTWFPDTGATHHMTADDSNFINRKDYHGPDQVTVANGASLPILGTDDEDNLLQGLNSYRTSLSLPTLAKNENAECLADKIAEELDNQPCTAASTIKASQLANYNELIDKCKIDVNSTTESAIMPVCVHKLVPSLVLTNYTHSPAYAKHLNNSKFTGAGVGSEDDWMVVILTGNTPAASFAKGAGSSGYSKVGLGGFFMVYMLMGLALFI